MHIQPHLGVFWRSESVIQIGIDPRIGIVIEGLTTGEQDLVAFLATPRTLPELAAEAHKRRISHDRLTAIVTMLRRARVLCGEECDPLPRRHEQSIYLHSLDTLGTAIGLALARSGVGRLVFDDPRVVGPGDHEALWPKHAGEPRNHAFLSALRHVAPHVETRGETHFAVLTGSRLVDPRVAATYVDRWIPHLAAWTEDVDVCVGPIVEPGESACVGCMHWNHLDEDAAWAYVAPQALMHAPLPAVIDARELAVALAVRAIIGYLAGMGNSLRNAMWRVGPLPAAPHVVEVLPHHSCGCIPR
ncbi:MAG: hypothetical protein LKK46_02130 [Ancrocorticia sp.]|jgi:hypothetical protein|nr:hypothetical protein [Ancrocorticia sp.]MCI2192917.1 hypothetical protein [Ancrocorticia sp.]